MLFLLAKKCLGLQKPFSADHLPSLRHLPIPSGLFGHTVGAGPCEQHPRHTLPLCSWLISTAGILSHSTCTARALSERASASLKCSWAALCTKGNRLCSPCSATLDTAAGTWSGRNKGFVRVAPWSSSSEGEKLLPPCQAVPAGRAELLCPLGYLCKR